MFRKCFFGLCLLQSFGFSGAANYSVPVPTELAPYDTFDLQSASVKIENGLVEMKYQLPLELVETSLQAKTIYLRGKLKAFPEQFEVAWPNGNGKGQCLLRSAGITCLVSYGFGTDIQSVLEYLKHKYSDAELEARSAVARTFGGEAGGVIHFPFN